MLSISSFFTEFHFKKNFMRNFPKHIMVLLLILATPFAIRAQFTITGTVTGIGGDPLSGASVKLRNSTEVGVTTAASGKFSILLPGKKGILDVSFVGYKSQSFSVDPATKALSIALVQDASNLDEVVVTGLATSVKRSNLANAVSSISASDLVGTTTQATLDGALYGKFTGANISSNSGAPGSGISIKLRGVTSLIGNSQPLFIVDGVYYDNSSIDNGLNAVSKAAAQGSSVLQNNPSNRLADLNPDDIERVEILKGASTAAIYGAKAAGGVVIITTKKGKSGKTIVEFSQSTGIQMQLRKLGGRTWDATKAEKAFGASGLALFNASGGKIFNYEDELYGQKGLMNNTRLSLSGGNDRTTFYTGFTYENDNGIIKRTGYEKKNFRFNLNQKTFKFLDLSLNYNYVESESNRAFFNNDNTGATLGLSFVNTPWWIDLHPDANGNYPNNPVATSNFLQTRDLITNREKVNRTLLGGTATFKILNSGKHNVKVMANGGIDYYTLNTIGIFPKELQFEKNGNGTNGLSAYGSTITRNQNGSVIAVYQFSASEKLNFRTQAGLTAEDIDQNTVMATATQLIGTQTNVNQAGAVQALQQKILQKDRGFFAQEEINYNDVFIGTAGLRGDRSSRNGNANKLYYFPKASLAINIANMPFWNWEQVSQLKLRGAYGESGNFAPFGAIYSPLVPVIYNGTTGSLIDVIQGNEKLEPERQKELELGIDFSILKNRISFEGTYYVKKANDLILQVVIPNSSGFTNSWQNAANIRNRGVELQVNAIPVASKDLNWNIQVLYWKNRAIVTRLDLPPFNTGGFGSTLGTYRVQKGISPTQIVGKAGPKDKVEPVSGLGLLGNSEPDFQLSFTNNLKWKNFEFSVLCHWKKGGSNINLTNLLSDLFGTSSDYDEKTLDPTGTLTNGPFRLKESGNTASVWVQDATYFRVREMALNYRLPDFIKGVSQIKVGFSAHNLINIFKYGSYDPEVSNFGIQAINSNVEVTPFPSSKSIHFNVAVTF